MAISGGYVSKHHGRPTGRVDVKALPPVADLQKIPPPHDLDTERTVIAGVIDGSNRASDAGFLAHSMFYGGSHRFMWMGIQDLEGRGTCVDKTSLLGWLKDHELLGNVGGAEKVVEIYESTPATLPKHFLEHARRLEVLAKLRELAAVGQRVMSRCFVDHADPSEVFAEAERLVVDVVRSGPGFGCFRLDAEAIFEAVMPDEPAWLIKALCLAPGRVTLAAGSPDSGKTLAWQSIATSVAAGVDAWGVFNVARRGLVVHLNWDQELEATKRRYRKLLLGMGLSVNAVRGFLEVIDDPPFALDTDAGLAELRAICRGATLVIIDALTGSLAETDEKDPSVGRVLRRLGKISEQTGCVIVVIHHAVKPPQLKGRGAKERDVMHDVRGSGAIPGAAGAVFVQSVIRKAELYAVTMARTPTVAKRALDPFALRFEDLAEDDLDRVELDGSRTDMRRGDAVRVMYVGPEELAALETASKRKKSASNGANVAFDQFADTVVLELVKAYPDASGAQIQQRSGRSKDRVYPALEHLEKTGRVASRPGPKGAKLWRAL